MTKLKGKLIMKVITCCTGAKDKHRDGFAVYKMKLDKARLPRLGETEGLSVVHVSTFPPRRCGIATFTEDLTHAMDEVLTRFALD